MHTNLKMVGTNMKNENLLGSPGVYSNLIQERESILPDYIIITHEKRF